jgi:predicted GH43/DUF377 family glycosyl hydrolase/PKD repeat protein
MRYYLALMIMIAALIAIPEIGPADWQKYPANPVLDHGVRGSWDALHVSHPSVLYDGTLYHLWYAGYNGVQWSIGYARSRDGIDWEVYPGNPVLSDGLGDVWDGTSVSQPCVLFDGERYRMWYAGYDGEHLRIGYATSNDGIAWNKHPNPVLDVGTTGSWDAMGVSSPTVVFDGIGYRMWYAGYDGEHLRIGYATSNDGIAWNKHPNPVLDVGMTGSWDAMGVSGPCAVDLEGKIRIWYSGYDGLHLRLGLSETSAPIAHAHVNPAIYEATSPAGAEVSLDGSLSVGADGRPITDDTSYAWDFDGDGLADATGRQVRHVYPLGTHIATLFVTDRDQISQDSISIRVEDTRPPVVTLLSPIGGEIFPTGEALPIRWDIATDAVSLESDIRIGIFIRLDEGEWQPIVSDEANDGLYEGWVVPGILESDRVQIKLEAADASGNVGLDVSAAFAIDRYPPEVRLTAPNGGEVLRGGSVFPITWQPAMDTIALSERPISLFYSQDGGANWTMIAEQEWNDGEYAWSLPMLDAEVLVRIEARDCAGKVGSDVSDGVFMIDSTSPSSPTLTSPADGTVTDQSELTFEGTAEAGSTVTVWDGDSILGNVMASDGTFRYLTTLADGVHSFSVTATDAAGNVSEASAPVVVTVDTVAPVVVTFSSGKAKYRTNETVQITYAVTDALSGVNEVVIHAGEVEYSSLPDEGQVEISPPLTVGRLTATLTATDAAGNTVTASTSAVVEPLLMRMDVVPNVFKIHAPKKRRKSREDNEGEGARRDDRGKEDREKERRKPPVLLVTYLSPPEGIAVTDIEPSSLRLNGRSARKAITREAVLEAVFEVDIPFVAALLSLPESMIVALRQDTTCIRVFLNEPADIASLTLGSLQMAGKLKDGCALVSEDASRHLVLKKVAAPAARVADRTFLAQNYPNPFNPDTWIPYALASDAVVDVRIFDLHGRMVRRIHVGYREAGFYTERNNAVHWDGYNDAGERVSSGVYFYTLQAGDFTATRRMVIMK